MATKVDRVARGESRLKGPASRITQERLNRLIVARDSPNDLLAIAWELHGEEPSYPLSTADAFKILGTMGYQADRPRLDYCTHRLGMEQPEKKGGALQWRESDILRFAAQLERMGKWLETPWHYSKLRWREFVQGHLSVLRERKFLEMLREDETIGSLLDWLAESDERETREKVAGVLREKLVSHGINVEAR